MAFDRFHHPPPARPFDPLFDLAPIDQEAQRQFDLFYPPGDDGARSRTLAVMVAGITQMCRRGAARVTGAGLVEFWNPVEGLFQEYDAAYNRLMMEFMADFKARCQQGMQRHAEEH